MGAVRALYSYVEERVAQSSLRLPVRTDRSRMFFLPPTHLFGLFWQISGSSVAD